jgi:Bacterial capsule synthesis protein PGA_cap
MRALAQQLIELGADVYWGHSNHTPLGIECYRGRPIVYAAGDLVDDYAVDPRERNDGGFVFVAEVVAWQVQWLRLYPTMIETCRVRRARGEEGGWLQARMHARAAALGTTVELHSDWCEVAMR